MADMADIIAWLWFGVISSAACNWSVRLSFRDRVTLGTILAWAVGIALPPLALLLAVVWFCCWAFDDPDQRYIAVKWPDWWGRFRYKQHRAVRFVWHLGAPPAKEDFLSGWRDAPYKYKTRR